MVAPARATAPAMVNACSSPSTEQGPAMMASWRLPMAQRPTEMTVSCGWYTRLTSLNGTGMCSTDSISGQVRTRSQSTPPPSPTAPRRTWPPWSVRCTDSPNMRSRVARSPAVASDTPRLRSTSIRSFRSRGVPPQNDSAHAVVTWASVARFGRRL